MKLEIDIHRSMEGLTINGNRENFKGTVPENEIMGMDEVIADMKRLCVDNSMDRMEEDVKCQQCTAQKMSRTLVNFLKGLRSKKWEKKVGWDEQDMDRKLSSKDALPEQIQEYIIGSDMVQLYPNLEVDKVVQRVKEAVVESEIVWQDFDYLEGVRYLALNWTQDQCNRHELRRVLPVRRGKTGTRPSILGTGP